jgi:transcriptional regulator with XRE-family HTH domain
LTESALARAGSHGDSAAVPVAPSDEEAEQLVLGRALRELRQRKQLTQEGLADLLGIDPTYVSQVERGRRGVRWFTVIRFLGALDATLGDLAAEVERDRRA